MGKAIRTVLMWGLMVIGLGVGSEAWAQLFGEVIAEFRAYLNPEGKYEIVHTPTPTDPFLWEIEGATGYNSFGLRRGLIGYRHEFNEHTLAEIAVRTGETEEEGREILLDRAYLELSNPEALYYEFQFGYLHTPGLKWIRNNVWQWDMFEYPILEYLGLVPRSQLGINLGAGLRLYQFETGLAGSFLNGGEWDDEDFDQYQARWTARLRLEKFSLSSIIGYTLNGEKEKEGYQELWQYGLALSLPRLKIGGEYFSGEGFIPAGEVYLLGRWPKGLPEYLGLAGRTEAQGREIEYNGWSASADLAPLKNLHLIYRYDFFDPSMEYDDDQENLNLVGIAYELNSGIFLGVSYQRQGFQSTELPISGGKIEINPIQILSISLQAKLP